MRNYLFVFLFLFSLTARAIVPSGVPSATLGGFGSQVASMSPTPGGTNVALAGSDAFGVHGGRLSVTGNAFYQLFRDGSAGNFANAVPSGSSWRCTNFTYKVGSANGGLQLVFSPNAFTDGASSITSGVYQCGGAAVYCLSGSPTGAAVVDEGLAYNFTGPGIPGFQANDNTQSYQVRAICRQTTP